MDPSAEDCKVYRIMTNCSFSLEKYLEKKSTSPLSSITRLFDSANFSESLSRILSIFSSLPTSVQPLSVLLSSFKQTHKKVIFSLSVVEKEMLIEELGVFLGMKEDGRLASTSDDNCISSSVTSSLKPMSKNLKLVMEEMKRNLETGNSVLEVCSLTGKRSVPCVVEASHSVKVVK
jgi:hypothetical protein